MACGIYKKGSTAKYDQNMKFFIENEYHWVFLAVVVFGRMVVFVNAYPMCAWKSKV